MPASRTRPTSADVAREAGVSRATVSYVLNDNAHQKIPESTRRRVLDAAARLGYLPSAAARALRTGRSDVVLLLLPDWPLGATVGRFLEALSTLLAEVGLALLAHPRPRSTGAVSELWKAVTPAAVVSFLELDDAETAAMRAAGVELLIPLLDRSRRSGVELELPQQAVGRLQAEHLASAGHRRLGYAGDPDARVRAFAEARLDGVRRACADRGLDAPAVHAVGLAIDRAADAVRAWREAGVTAVCAYNDETALAVLAGMRRHGLAAPGDLAVIGVDDIPPAASADPPLTTVVMDQAVVAEHIARSIIAALESKPVLPRSETDPVHLIVRDSA